MNDPSKNYSQMHKSGEYIAVYHPQGRLSAAGKIIDWDPQNHQLSLETTPRYLMTDKGFVNNTQMRTSTVRFDPTGQMIKELRPEQVREEYPINQAIELRGRVVNIEYGQGASIGVLAGIDNNYFRLQPHINRTSEQESTILDTARLIPNQGASLIELEQSLEEIVERDKKTQPK